ncbi:transposase [Flavobacterium hungaricum]|uniref:Transposase n=1 Tax=Flavobacterium hungaricum TaxID=2082725 RepID=A0ABR9THV5_9FLAO|nr:transposase [Flavobacterium hungaricum]MBE8724609.1 transposase [Flavobacterium hungaricum]
MSLYKEKFKTDSHRLKNWDYSNEAVYFITIVTQDRKCIFGSIVEDKMVLNENGKIVETELLKSIKIRKNWFFHNWVIMPNHIHLLIEIQDKENHSHDSVETHSSATKQSLSTTENTISSEAKFSRKTKSISSFVAIFKSVTTKQIGRQQKIWQANYHDHIVRNYKRFEIIYNYIKTNPQRWETDSINLKF